MEMLDKGVGVHIIRRSVKKNMILSEKFMHETCVLKLPIHDAVLFLLHCYKIRQHNDEKTIGGVLFNSEINVL